MGKTAKLFRVLPRPRFDRGLSGISKPFRLRRISCRSQECLTVEEKGEFAMRMFSKSWAAECSKQGVQAPVIVLKRGPRNEGRLEMYWENEHHLLSVALTALGGDIRGSLDARRSILKHRVEAAWGGLAHVQCQIEPGRPARMVETFSSFAQMIAIVYAEAMVMHKRNLQRQAEQINDHVNFAPQPDRGLWSKAPRAVQLECAQGSRR